MLSGLREFLGGMFGHASSEHPTLPPPPNDEDNGSQEDEPLPPRGPNEPHWVLVVDDDADAREFLQILLRGEGYEVTTRSNGFHAIRHLEKRYLERHLAGMRRLVPSVVLLDVMMPVMDGLEFYHQVRMLERAYGRLTDRIIILSAYCDYAAETLPWVLHIQKPINHARLLEVVAQKASLFP